MFAAGFSALVTNATVDFLHHGNIFQTLKNVVSLDNLKSIAISVISAGLTDALVSNL